MEISNDDNTAVLRMKRDFKSFLSKERPAGNNSRSHIPLGESFLDSEAVPNVSSSSSVSMQQILEKDKEDKQRQAEMIRQKTYISQLESKISAMEASHKRSVVEMEKEVDKARQESEIERERNKQLRHQYNMLGRREQEAQDNIAQLQQDMAANKQKLEQKIRSLQAEKLHSQTETEELEMTLRQKISEQKREMLRQHTEYQISQTDLLDTKEQLENMLRKYSDAKQQIKKLEESNLESFDSQMKIKTLEQQLESVEGDSRLVQVSKDKLARYAELEKQNNKLKEEVEYHRAVQENVAMLKEQCESMRRKVERAEQRSTETAALQVRCQQLQDKLNEWGAADQLGGARKPMSPSQLTSRIQDLQNTNAILLEKQGQLQASVTSLEQEAGSNGKKLKSLNEQLAKEQTKNGQLADFVKRAQRKISLVTKERDSYKSMIEAANEGEARGGGGGGAARQIQKQQEDMLESHRQQAAQQDRELEARAQQITALRANVSTLQQELSQLKEQLSRPGSSTEADKQIILALREQVAQLEKQVETVGEEKLTLEDRLERRHLQGDYDPSRTKVIHLSMNPIAEAQSRRAEELGQLKEDNSRLRKRLQLLEEGGGQDVEDLTVKVAQRMQEPNSSEEVKEMKKELEKAETANKRLVEAFTKTSHEFREVCYQLLGYRLDFPCQNQYKLMSMYAETPEDFFLFKNTSDDGMQMLGTEFSSQQQIKEKIATYLESGNSIPAFLSSVTMDLFSQSTVMAQ